ncbi:MAG TPA: UDP-N-acetylmuramate dehydrogenase [Terriglobales bacterium]|nr:UDP-N-acetylmuramate dehydrogenase [Terriglobales bacterium]
MLLLGGGAASCVSTMNRPLSRTMIFQENIPLAPFTTLRVGGPAHYFAEARCEDEVRQGLEFARGRALPLFVLGGGSNLLVADSGFPGLVLRIAIGGLTHDSSGSRALFSVGAGYEWDAFVAQAVAQSCAGIECLSGIPGSVGGTPVQNVGAYGQEVAQTIDSVEAFDTRENQTVVVSNAGCGFRYRSSIFNTSERGRYIILRVKYRLQRDAAPTIKYADLQRRFAGARMEPSLVEVREAVREIRRLKGMLLVEGDPDSHSAGSFFKNPVLTKPQFEDLISRAEARSLKVPAYPALEAQHKVSAAWLVEHSGFSKGFRLGAAAISTKHALALVNTGNAHASDILELKDAIQRRVQSEWGILLETEPVLVGF